MRNAVILCLVGSECSATDLQHLAESARDHSAYLSVLVVGQSPPVPVYSYGIGPYGAIDVPQHWHETLKHVTDQLSEAGKNLKDFLAAQDVQFDVRVLCSDFSALREAISDRALSADLIVVGDDLRANKDLFNLIAHNSVFHSPTGVAINTMRHANSLKPRRVFLAWNKTLPAARAAHAALPMMRDAEETSVALFDPVLTKYGDGESPGADVARWLSHHGCTVTVNEYPSGDIETGKAITRRAAEFGADLVVMGAFDHSRARQTLFGGTTLTLMTQTDLPVLFSH